MILRAILVAVVAVALAGCSSAVDPSRVDPASLSWPDGYSPIDEYTPLRPIESADDLSVQAFETAVANGRQHVCGL